jgi:transcriptional regulator with XRE-family HTH domain
MTMFDPIEPPDGFTLPLSSAHLAWQLDMIGWSDGELARRLNVAPTKVSKWRRGKSNIPNQVALWLETLAQMVTSIPNPIGWCPDKTMGRQHHAGTKLAPGPFAPQAFFRSDGEGSP